MYNIRIGAIRRQIADFLSDGNSNWRQSITNTRLPIRCIHFGAILEKNATSCLMAIVMIALSLTACEIFAKQENYYNFELYF